VSSYLTSLALSPFFLILLILLLYLFLGMFLDAISTIALTVPVLFPTVTAFGFDPIWFGIFVVLMCEIGLITPPVGINCFVVAGVAPDVPLTKVFKGVIPFLIADLAVMGLLIAFPKIVLFLPGFIGQ
jgi:TRAP-type C4-dicarboxylate transport system permease large subunit